MPHYRQFGDVPAKRHVRHAGPDGSQVFEELMGEEGFVGASSLLYHRHSPSALIRIECADGAGWAEPEFHPTTRFDRTTSGHTAWRHTTPQHAAWRHTAWGTPSAGDDICSANDAVRLSWAAVTAHGPLCRNAVGDELAYVQRGSARLDSVFGSLDAHQGDYVVVPRGTTHRWVPTPEADLLIIESTGHIEVPPRHLTATGQHREGAPFSERDIRVPIGEPLLEEGEAVPVFVRTRAGTAMHVHARHPFDVVGWDGCVYPWAFQISDFEPIVGRLHQPPPVHQTFAGPGFVVCSFVPRPLDFDPDAVRIPYHHANVDSDEVLFYSDGDFMSRAGSGIDVGSISLHPAGFVHGPQPAGRAAGEAATQTGETAVMIDTFAPLGLTRSALEVSDPDYLMSWNEPDRGGNSP